MGGFYYFSFFFQTTFITIHVLEITTTLFFQIVNANMSTPGNLLIPFYLDLTVNA